MYPALVLTAGLGTRLEPITRLAAKAAVPLAGQTLVERLLRRLAAEGIVDAVLNLHHRPESITSVVGDGTHFGVRVRYSWEAAPLGSAGGPRRALPLLDSDRFFIVNGDTLCDVDLAALVRDHEATGAAVTMAVVPNPAPDHYNGLTLDADGRVTGMVPKGHAEGSWHFIGVQVVDKAIFAPLTDGAVVETVSGVYRERVARGAGDIRGLRIHLPFLDVGTPADYLAGALTLAAPAANAVEPGARVSPSARLARCVVWNGAEIGDEAALESCIVTNVSVPPGYRASRAVLMPAAVVRAGDRASVAGDLAAFPLSLV